MQLPTWSECQAKVAAGAAMTGIERFIYEQEPRMDKLSWRTALAALVTEYSSPITVMEDIIAAMHEERISTEMRAHFSADRGEARLLKARAEYLGMWCRIAESSLEKIRARHSTE